MGAVKTNTPDENGRHLKTTSRCGSFNDLLVRLDSTSANLSRSVLSCQVAKYCVESVVTKSRWTVPHSGNPRDEEAVADGAR